MYPIERTSCRSCHAYRHRINDPFDGNVPPIEKRLYTPLGIDRIYIWLHTIPVSGLQIALMIQSKVLECSSRNCALKSFHAE